MLENVVGQYGLKRSIEVAIVASRKRKEVMEHILLSGLGGLGKTHLLNSICDELGYFKIITQGNRLTVSKVKDWLVEGCQSAAAVGKPLFAIIDEIHEMSDSAQDELYYPMDNGTVLTLGEPINLAVPFCIAGATTNPNELDGKSLIDRFIHTWNMKELSVDELMTLISRFYLKEKMLIDWVPMQTLAERSKGVPRLALKYARRARDFAQCQNRKKISLSDIEMMFSELGIDAVGLDEIQRKYLTILYESDKPVGKEALSAMLGELRPLQLTQMVEPFLWKMGFITSSSRGRELTDKGFKHLTTGEIFSE